MQMPMKRRQVLSTAARCKTVIAMQIRIVTKEGFPIKVTQGRKGYKGKNAKYS